MFIKCDLPNTTQFLNVDHITHTKIAEISSTNYQVRALMTDGLEYNIAVDLATETEAVDLLNEIMQPHSIDVANYHD